MQLPRRIKDHTSCLGKYGAQILYLHRRLRRSSLEQIIILAMECLLSCLPHWARRLGDASWLFNLTSPLGRIDLDGDTDTVNVGG